MKTKLITSLFIMTVLGLTACSKSEPTENTQANTASVAEAQAIPMSAAPADDKNAPVVINDSNATADLGGETAETVTENEPNASVAAAVEGGDNNIDNSEMEHISEDAEVIDSEPASPNAPKATDSQEKSVNQKVAP